MFIEVQFEDCLQRLLVGCNNQPNFNSFSYYNFIQYSYRAMTSHPDDQKFQANLLTSLNTFQNKLKCYDYICAINKKNELELMRLLHLWHYKLLDCDLLKSALRKCFEVILLLVSSTQFKKYGHRIPTLLYLVEKFQVVSDTKLQIKQQELTQQIKKNWQTSDIKYNPQTQISPSELRILQTNQINSIISDVSHHHIILNNPNCVGCTQAFIRNTPVINSNPCFKNIIGLPQKSKVEMIVLQRYTSSLCNCGGGVILVGAELRNDLLYVTGLKFKSQQEVINKQIQIQQAMENIKPKNYYTIQRMMIHTNYAEKENVADEYMRWCFRIKIMPWRVNQFTCLELSAKGYQNVYQIYKLNDWKLPEKQVISEDLYNQIHQKYIKSTSTKSSHPYICCFKPFTYNSSLFQYYQTQGLFVPEDFITREEVQEENYPNLGYPDKFDDNPSFVYQNCSLVVVKSKKQERYIKDLIAVLKNGKYSVDLSQPFSNSFKNCSRSIWLLSHQVSRIEIKQLLNRCINSNLIPSDVITIMPVHKTLQLDRNKLSEYNQKIISRRFQQRYEQKFQIDIGRVVQKNLSQKQIIYMSFNDFGQSIYAYFIFQQLNIRPIFVRQTSMNKNKSLKQGTYYKTENQF